VPSNTDIFSLDNKVAVVSGGGSGIGFAISTYLALGGAKVIIVSRNEDKLIKAQKMIEEDIFKHKALGSIHFMSANLEKEDAIVKTASSIINKYGNVDIVVNAAGINLRQKAEDISFETWNKTIDINLKSAFFFSREFTKDMKANSWGKIINIASLQSVRAFSNSIAYGASKGGVMQLTKAMAEEYSKYGINVNAIAPGFFETELTASVFKDEKKVKQLSSQTAMNRNGKMSDFKGISLFLSSHASDYITGQTIFLDGGFTAK